VLPSHRAPFSPSATPALAAVVYGARTGTDGSADQSAPTSADEACDGCATQRSDAHAPRGTASRR